jgi:hypothetical protein
MLVFADKTGRYRVIFTYCYACIIFAHKFMVHNIQVRQKIALYDTYYHLISFLIILDLVTDFV